MAKRSSTQVIASLLAETAENIGTGDTPQAKRITIAQLYGQFRATRKLARWAVELRGHDSSIAREARIAEQDAWNNLQIMKALIWLDD